VALQGFHSISISGGSQAISELLLAQDQIADDF
jgi:hypothetical protein